MQCRVVQCALALSVSPISASLGAQIDYRNLDGHRPSRVEDAYPIERHAFEFSLPYRLETGPGSVYSFTPELAWGAFRNGSVGVSVDWQWLRSGVAARAPRVRSNAFLLANLAGESPGRPALAVRADLASPLDGGGVGSASLTLGGIATRSWGLVRLHLNGGWTVAAPSDPLLRSEPRWWAGLAVDRTLFRTSTLLIGELVAERAIGRSDPDWTVGLGLRRQMTPTVVFDVGAELVRGDRDRFGMTVGMSHAFAIAGLMTRRCR